ncbi:MAG: hypothetical protein DPW09_33450 [Anaerolineae bacterium]|nr:hypothetical protein [Anaerolineae bacterium]
MAVQAMWAHGHMLQIEFADRIQSARRFGSSISIEGRQNTENWFHFAIPTPVIINDRRLRTGSVLLISMMAKAGLRPMIISEYHPELGVFNSLMYLMILKFGGA